jgi:exopolyphosphatase/guanosine-5'-triphosphate,3'-diphosphate pyrophosphatase
MTWTTANCAERALSKGRPTYAALDLGTNNCRLMIARARRGGYSVVDTYSRIVRLGEGLTTTGRLSDAAQERTIEALKRCTEIIARWDVRAVHAVTTEAARAASNSNSFIERVRQETGLVLEVIGPEMEADLALRGSSSLIDAKARQIVVMDIGGGSTELSFVKVGRDGKRRQQLTICAVASLPFGVVRLSDGLSAGGFAGEHYRLIARRVADSVRQAGQGCLDPLGRRDHLIGTSGTSTSLAAMQKGLRRYRRKEVDGSWLSANEVGSLARRLEGLGYDGRRVQPCIGEGRADLIMPGCAILEGVLEATGLKRLRVADRGLREGLIVSLIAQHEGQGQARRLEPVVQPAE